MRTLYVLANMAYFHVLPFSDVARSQHVASDVVVILAGLPFYRSWGGPLRRKEFVTRRA